MDQNKTEGLFNSLEFNLYELLNISLNSTAEEIKKSFRRIIKKFHPDKMSEVEEKLYYNITLAHHILSNPNTRSKYDNWLLNSNKQHNTLKDNFKADEQTVKEYFPKTKEEAAVDFQNKFDMLGKRHGEVVEDKRTLNSIYKEKEKERTSVQITKETFSNMDEFNTTFSSRKKNGTYNTALVKRNTDIQPFTFKNNKYAELKDFDNVYIKDTQLTYAFELLPENDSKVNNKSIAQKLDDYNKNNFTMNNNKFINEINKIF
jgi:curved DNA-binding protein CbpA